MGFILTTHPQPLVTCYPHTPYPTVPIPSMPHLFPIHLSHCHCLPLFSPSLILPFSNLPHFRLPFSPLTAFQSCNSNPVPPWGSSSLPSLLPYNLPFPLTSPPSVAIILSIYKYLIQLLIVFHLQFYISNHKLIFGKKVINVNSDEVKNNISLTIHFSSNQNLLLQ